MPIKLLLADDHHLFLDGLISLLKRERDFAIEDTADNGTEALDLALRKDYDVCLLDISMPGMDGIEVCKKIKEAKPNQKIIMLTTYDDNGIIMEMIHTGVNGYLLKNCTKRQLVDAIRTVASGKLYFTEEAHRAVMSSHALKVKQQQKAKEEQLSQAKKARYQQAFAAYQGLPEDQQAALKKAFLDTTNPLVIKQSNAEEKKGKQAFSSPLVLSTFKVFLVEEQGF